MTVVVDTSAVLALMFREPGAEFVRSRLAGARICSVNLCEVVGKLTDRRVEFEKARDLTFKLKLAVVSFDEHLAIAAARLLPKAREHGLSLADRACLSLALRERLPVLTGDREWADVDVGVEVILIR